MRHRFATLALLVPLAIGAATAAHAAWPKDGLGVCTASCGQVPTAMVADGEGGFFVAWNDQRDCSSYTIVYLQHLGRDGTPAAAWPAEGRPICTTFSGQVQAVLAPDGNGGVFAAWNDLRTSAGVVAIEHVARDGAQLWNPAGVLVSDSAGTQALPGIVPDGAGGLYVGWCDARRGRNDGAPHHHPIDDLFVQHLDASGARTWGANGVAAVTSSVIGSHPVLSLTAGGVLVGWQEGFGPVRLQRFDAGGARLLGDDGLGVSGPFGPPFVSDARGGLAAAFMFGGAPGQFEIRAQRVDSAGALQWGPSADPVSPATYNQTPTGLAADGAGGLFVTWFSTTGSGDWDVYAQRLDETGALRWDSNGVPVCTAPGYQLYPQVVPDGAGGCLIAWYDGREPANGYDVYAQHLSADGSVTPGWAANGVALCRAAGDQQDPLIVVDGAGGAFVAWLDARGAGDVYAQHVSQSGVVGDTAVAGGVIPPPAAPTALALAPAFANPGAGATLAWNASLPDGSPARLALVDARGRELAATVATAPGGGRVTLRLVPARALPPGLYFVRLRQGGRAISHKFTVVR